MKTLATDTGTDLVPFSLSNAPSPTDPAANPFRLVVDPAMRARLRDALFGLIENHDAQLADHVAGGELALESYKEYIEIFAHSLKQTMECAEGVGYLMESCGFKVAPETINLRPEMRWKRA